MILIFTNILVLPTSKSTSHAPTWRGLPKTLSAPPAAAAGAEDICTDKKPPVRVGSNASAAADRVRSMSMSLEVLMSGLQLVTRTSRVVVHRVYKAL